VHHLEIILALMIKREKKLEIMKKKLQHILKPLVQKKIGPKNYGI
jgi:hypothetical protein